MPDNTFQLAVNVGPLFAAAAAAQVAAKRVIKLSGTIYANALRTLTPPHGEGATLQNTRGKRSKGILKLRERIAEDIMGGATIRKARPVLTRDGRWLAFDERGSYSSGGGHFGLVVPTVNRFGKTPIPFEDPRAVLRDLVVYRQKGAMRRWGRPPRELHFVRPGALRAAVRENQWLAGRTISGWAPGARFFATGASIAPGFYEDRGGRGEAGADEDLDENVDIEGLYGVPTWTTRSNALEHFTNVEPVDAYIANQSWPSRLKNKSAVTDSAVYSLARHALAKMEANIIKFYRKKAAALLS